MRPFTTNAVLDELRAGPSRACDFDWLTVEPVDHLAELRAFMAYVEVMGAGRRHLGEATVLAWAEVHGGLAIIDDQAAKKAAKRRGVACHGSLWLIVQGYKDGVLRVRRRRADSSTSCETPTPASRLMARHSSSGRAPRTS